jgi:hypothetical protein
MLVDGGELSPFETDQPPVTNTVCSSFLRGLVERLCNGSYRSETVGVSVQAAAEEANRDRTTPSSNPRLKSRPSVAVSQSGVGRDRCIGL